MPAPLLASSIHRPARRTAFVVPARRAPLAVPAPCVMPVLAALLVLPLWKGAHHVRSLLIDFGGAERDGLVGSVLYLVALVGSVMAVVRVVGL